MSDFSYPRAGLRAPPGVREEIERWRSLPQISPLADKTQVPLLYYLLGSGTGPYKMSKGDAAYQDKPVGNQCCKNCSSAYRNLVRGDVICSQVEGEVNPRGWCKTWNTDRL